MPKRSRRINNSRKTPRATHQARLEHIYREAMAGWHASKQPRTITHHRKFSSLSAVEPAGLAALPTSICDETITDRHEASAGDCQFLATALGALIEQRARGAAA